MNSIIFIASGVVLVLVILSRIPGLDIIIRPIIDIIFTLIKVIAANASYWAVWLTKQLISSHTDLLRHLIKSAEDIDPTVAVRKRES